MPSDWSSLEEHGEEPRLDLEVRAVRALEGDVHGLLRVGERERALGLQAAAELEGLLAQLPGS